MLKLYIKTYGCQMNIYDSNKIINLLYHYGYRLTLLQENADVIILNTCNIRYKSSEKVYSTIGFYKEEAIIIVAGCVAQSEGIELMKRSHQIDIVIGTQSYYKLPVLLENLKKHKMFQIKLDFLVEEKFSNLSFSNYYKYSSFLTIQEGCNKFCHFCCVPYTRGKEYSRPQKHIIIEAKEKLKQGAKEIVLLGQNVSAYDNYGRLSNLIKKITKINGLKRLRYITSHPKDMDDIELLKLHQNESKLMPYLHLPIQSGSNKVLKMMNRQYNIQEYLSIINKLKFVRPDMVFSSDFIVGYPGESDCDFQSTLYLINQVDFSQCYSFKYSPRSGTTSSLLSNQINEKTKNKRLQKVQLLLYSKQLAFNKSLIGTVIQVLFNKKGKYSNQIIGISIYLQTVFVNDNNNYIGNIVPVYVKSANFFSLQGVIL